MRVPGGVLALLAAVCILCTACGCLGASSPPPSGGGITSIDLPEPEGYTLTEALAELDILSAEGGLNTTGTSMHQVLGNRVTLDGQAAAWAIGLKDGEEVRWLTSGITGWRETSLRAPLPDDEVNMTAILSPEDLFTAQEDAIRPVMKRLNASTVDIGLAEGVYTVTVRSNAGVEVLAFQADTGGAIV
ncbi:hypothetical protein FGW20_02670 [Methanoculleus sp. FWC-SCC3]|uniref:Uncharacterized protein n=1 Tax=Methanoculleus methanifontis TaxID=2584086 RepID=A0ABT8LYU8_9EURY|nr:hypothetical protein [Methanoculleus sp. FWC-SCC3]MDN7011965.1 hypothetical protein [Methanoculleus sp. FWC-SCC3]